MARSLNNKVRTYVRDNILEGEGLLSGEDTITLYLVDGSVKNIDVLIESSVDNKRKGRSRILNGQYSTSVSEKSKNKNLNLTSELSLTQESRIKIFSRSTKKNDDDWSHDNLRISYSDKENSFIYGNNQYYNFGIKGISSPRSRYLDLNFLNNKLSLGIVDAENSTLYSIKGRLPFYNISINSIYGNDLRGINLSKPYQSKNFHGNSNVSYINNEVSIDTRNTYTLNKDYLDELSLGGRYSDIGNYSISERKFNTSNNSNIYLRGTKKVGDHSVSGQYNRGLRSNLGTYMINYHKSSIDKYSLDIAVSRTELSETFYNNYSIGAGTKISSHKLSFNGAYLEGELNESLGLGVKHEYASNAIVLKSSIFKSFRRTSKIESPVRINIDARKKIGLHSLGFNLGKNGELLSYESRYNYKWFSVYGRQRTDGNGSLDRSYGVNISFSLDSPKHLYSLVKSYFNESDFYLYIDQDLNGKRSMGDTFPREVFKVTLFNPRKNIRLEGVSRNGYVNFSNLDEDASYYLSVDAEKLDKYILPRDVFFYKRNPKREEIPLYIKSLATVNLEGYDNDSELEFIVECKGSKLVFNHKVSDNKFQVEIPKGDNCTITLNKNAVYYNLNNGMNIDDEILIHLSKFNKTKVGVISDTKEITLPGVGTIINQKLNKEIAIDDFGYFEMKSNFKEFYIDGYICKRRDKVIVQIEEEFICTRASDKIKKQYSSGTRRILKTKRPIKREEKNLLKPLADKGSPKSKTLPVPNKQLNLEESAANAKKAKSSERVKVDVSDILAALGGIITLIGIGIGWLFKYYKIFK